jgi:hypothetical protein
VDEEVFGERPRKVNSVVNRGLSSLPGDDEAGESIGVASR